MPPGDGPRPFDHDTGRLSRLFDQLGCGMYTVDTAGLITAVNAYAAALLGYSPEELLGVHAHQVLHARRPDGSTYPVEQCPLLGVLRHGVPAEAEADAFLDSTGSLLAVSWISSPLRDGDRVEGAAVLFRSAADQQRVEQERTHALEAERLQRSLVESAHERLRLLSEITQALSSTLDATEALGRLTRLIVPRLARWCVVDVVDDDGSVRPVALAHRDPDLVPPGQFERELPWLVSSRPPLTTVLSGGGSVRVAVAERVPGGRDGQREAQWELLAHLGGQEMLVAPLVARGRVLGALTLVADVGETFGVDDVALVEDIGRRAGLALDNARLHAGQRDVAEALQRSLLTDLPRVDHIRLAARYLPAGQHSRVGGDWYDAFVLADGCTTMVIGDIAGHDVEAAARMGQVRNMLRGIAADRTEPPSEIVRRLDCAIEVVGAASYATLIFGKIELLDEAAQVRELWFTNAGHPPPLLVHADGQVEMLGGEPDLPLGVRPGEPRHDVTVLLPPGCTVLLYTDGLVEHRSEDVSAGLARLRNVASRHAAEPVEAFCDALLAALAVDDVADDIAVLALRVPHVDDDGSVRATAPPQAVKDATGRPSSTEPATG